MSETAYTNGPWVVSGRTATCIRTEDQEQRIAYIETADNDFETCIANARLIAASPELLEALKVCINVMELVDGENDCSRGIDAAEAAIAKAEGRS